MDMLTIQTSHAISSCLKSLGLQVDLSFLGTTIFRSIASDSRDVKFSQS